MLKKLTPLNLIWVNNQGFWLYTCQSCGQAKFERRRAWKAH